MAEYISAIAACGPAIGTPALEQLPSFGAFLDFIGLPEIRKLEERFGDTNEDAKTRG